MAPAPTWHPITPDWLPPIEGLARVDPEHRYHLHGQAFPVSVTGVLAIGKTEFAMRRIEATRAHWEPRGLSTHRALELFLGLERGGNDGADIAELEELLGSEWAPWIDPLVSDPRWRAVTVCASERPTCCPARRVAGTYDCAFLDPALAPAAGRPGGLSGPARVLADLKTLGENGSTYSTAAQLGGYMALEAAHGHWYDYGQTIWARSGQATFSRLYSRAECLLAWAAAWARWRATPPAPF